MRVEARPAGLFQSTRIYAEHFPEAGLKQPSLRCMDSQNLGRRNAALCRST
jgi:hypothetical protein